MSTISRSKSWRRLKSSEILRAGDRPIYVDGLLGSRIIEAEFGLRADESGYYGVARLKKQKSKAKECE